MRTYYTYTYITHTQHTTHTHTHTHTLHIHTQNYIVLKYYIVQSEDGFSHKSLLLYVILALYQCK